MQDIVKLQNLHKSPLTTLVGLIVIGLALYQQYQESDWMQTSIGLGIGLFLSFLPDSKTKYQQSCNAAHDDPNRPQAE